MKRRDIPTCKHCGVPNKTEVHADKGKYFVGDTFSHYQDIPCNCIEEQTDLHDQLLKLGFTKINNSMYRSGDTTLQSANIHEGKTIFEKIINTKRGFKVTINKKHHSVVTTMEQLEKLLTKTKGEK